MTAVETSNISVSPEHLPYIKATLQRLFPDIRPTKRVEALARGLGFNTWAAAKAWGKSTDPENRPFSLPAIMDHLGKFNFKERLVTTREFHTQGPLIRSDDYLASLEMACRVMGVAAASVVAAK